jgi:translation elongation factor EF-1alpha
MKPHATNGLNILVKYEKRKYIQIKPQVPKLNALIKLHKDTVHIIPVVDYKNAPIILQKPWLDG